MAEERTNSVLPEDPFDAVDPALSLPESSASATLAPNQGTAVSAGPAKTTAPTVENTDDEPVFTEAKQQRGMGRGTRMRFIVFGILGILLIGGAVLISFLPRLLESRESKQNAAESEITNTRPVGQGVNTGTGDELERDSDGDGLTDSEEATHNTDPDKPDTDGDGLSDRLEVEVYKTDPRDVDTDNDRFNDGEEVRQYYNPNGEGKLLDAKKAIDEFNAAQ